MRLTHVRVLVDDFGASFRWGIRVAYLRDPAANLLELYTPIPMDE